MVDLPTMRAIQVFEAVARCGSLTRAADDLCVTVGAVSQQVANLEESLNASLFERRGRSLVLTCWGRLYYESVRVAFDQLRLAQQKLQVARSKPSIIISALPSLALRWLRPLIKEWRSANTEATVHSIGTDEEKPLSNDYIDFRLCYGAEVRSYCYFSELYTDYAVPACAPDFLARNPVSSAADILASPLISIAWDPDRAAGLSWNDWAASVGEPMPERGSELTFSLSASALDAAIAGDGFVLAQVSMIVDDVAAGRLVIPVDRRARLPAPYFLAWDRDSIARPFGESFRNFLLKAGKRQGALSKGKLDLPGTGGGRAGALSLKNDRSLDLTVRDRPVRPQ